MRNKTLIALLLLLALVAAACTSGDDEGSDDASEEETSEADGEGDEDTSSDDEAAATDDTEDDVAAATGEEGSTLAATIDAGVLECGVNGQLAGFSLNEGGEYTGLDVDYCRAIAAAILDDPDAVNYTDLTAETRFTALQSGEVDVLSRNGTWTASRDGELGLQWTATTYFDGQGMLVNADDPAESVADMDGYLICVQTGTTTELNLETYFDNLGISYEPVNVADEAAVTENFTNAACDAYTTDRSGLASFAATYTGGETRILEDVMSKEPLGPAVRQGDDQWFDIVQWVVFATFQAEEYGIDSTNVDGFDSGDNADIARFLGQEEGQTLGTALGFPDEEWAARVIAAVGNYQEIFDRNIEPIGLDEGVNQLWTEGGLHYPPPYR
ncbi:amino acid ABC transporter substrate-binding protein [Euzebya tangerina]|uniref:amino acid ABC transporter substrate-binding protein n=1 Tax=Euzebya tangerina TaxID=591198 RepID=UPI00196A8CCE|nr:amino acid ABC transporter substrate-binding protein [Euzebya tangerina]